MQYMPVCISGTKYVEMFMWGTENSLSLHPFRCRDFSGVSTGKRNARVTCPE